jgi:acetyl esterase/lipase
MAAVAREMRAGEAGLGIVERRDAWHARAAAAPPPEGVEVEQLTLAGVACERVTADAAGPLVVFLHGGGYVSGSPATHRGLTAQMARSLAGEVLAIDYRLAPEHPYPAALEDVQAVWRELGPLAGGRPLLAAGDSAGAGLLVALLCGLGPDALKPERAWLLCPHADLTLAGDSFQRCEPYDFVLTKAALTETAAAYAGGLPVSDPRVSPLFADLSGLPPLLVQVGGHDLLFDEGVELARRAAAQGVDVTLTSAPAAPHAWYGMTAASPTAARHMAFGLRWLAGKV